MVGRLTWSQLRATRTVALLLGMVLAATAFTVLTAASRTSQLRTVGTVAAHFRPAYDILVRPKRARTELETRTGTVQPNFLSGIYGGITMAQYRQIQRIPEVQVAAPVAMVGYTMILAAVRIYLPAADYARPGRQLYRYTTTWVSAGGSNRITQPPSYLYLTPGRIHLNLNTGVGRELLPGGSSARVCRVIPGGATAPFSPAAQSAGYCWSKVDGLVGTDISPGAPRHGVYGYVAWELPMLIAAVDPQAEARLDGLNRAVISGRYLRENAGDGRTKAGPGPGQPTVPVLATSSSGFGEEAVTRVLRLAAPSSPPLLSVAMMTRDAGVPGRTVRITTVSAQQAYQQMLAASRRREGLDSIDNLWTVGPVRYLRARNGSLTAVPVDNPRSAWRLIPDAGGGLLPVPMDEEDTQYRSVHSHLPGSSLIPLPLARLAGIFDPARISAFSPLSQVPLGPYDPVAAAAANAASRRVLTGGRLLPSLNLGGYVSQPVQLITTLAALPALQNRSTYSGDLHARDPISVIRVRVAGVTGPNPVSLERIREVAQQIGVDTGLDVDIVAGSSPEPTIVTLPAGRFGRPALTLSEGWVKKGVAVAILTAVDKSSLALFTLILVVCVLFVANSATAAVRGRRHELGVLACLGWTRPRLFGLVLGELSVVGLGAGALGAGLALPLSAALDLHASPARALLAVPVAVGVAVVAGAVPAWLASRAEPVATVRPPALAVRRGHHPGGITALAMVNVARTPGRTTIGALALGVGVAGLTLLTAITVAFRGVVVGSLLGNAVAVQIRGVDFVAVGATIALGVLAVADTMAVSIRERAAELATIRSFGWRESALARLVVTEGTVIGAIGSLAGAALGLAAAAEFAGQRPPGLLAAAAAAAAAGVMVTAAAVLLPAQLLRRLPTAHLLAEE